MTSGNLLDVCGLMRAQPIPNNYKGSAYMTKKSFEKPGNLQGSDIPVLMKTKIKPCS